MNKIFIITGTSKGIGLLLSKLYLKENNIVIGCARSKSAIEHKNYRHFILDASDEKAVINMVKQCYGEFRKIDILINNAGVAYMNHILTSATVSLDKTFKSNFYSTFLFTREVGKIMSIKKGGKIINFSSVAESLNLQGEAIYAASKAAIKNFTQTVAKELGEFGITVNTIGISPMMTNLLKTLPKEKIENILKQQSISRMCEIDDIKNVIDFLISEKSSLITGQSIYLGGVW